MCSVSRRSQAARNSRTIASLRLTVVEAIVKSGCRRYGTAGAAVNQDS